MPASPSERQLAAQIAAHTRWARTPDRTAATSAARAALNQRFLEEAEGDPERAAHLRSAYFARAALRSAKARRKIEQLTTEAEAAEAELDAAGGGVA